MRRHGSVLLVGLAIGALAAAPVLAMPGASYKARGEASDTITGAVWDARLEFWPLPAYRVTLIDRPSGVEVRLPDVPARETYTEYVFEEEAWCGGQVWSYRNHGWDRATDGDLFEIDGWRKYCLGGPGGFRGDLAGHYGPSLLLHFTQFP